MRTAIDRIIISSNIGYCFGVKRAEKLARNALQRASGPVYTWGPLIHNPLVVSRLQRRGIIPVAQPWDLNPGDSLIIRSHGVARNLLNQAQNKGLNIVDATCPLVSRIHQLVSDASSEGKLVVVAGKFDHAEVKGIVGQVEYGPAPVVIASCNDKPGLEHLENCLVDSSNPQLVLVAQSTISSQVFQRLAFELNQRISKIPGAGFIVQPTLCQATSIRQNSTLELADRVSLMVVIGGRNSSNTRRLVEITEDVGTPVLPIEYIEDLSPKLIWQFMAGFLNKKRKFIVGVTAGASTPLWQVRAVICQLKRIMV